MARKYREGHFIPSRFVLVNANIRHASLVSPMRLNEMIDLLIAVYDHLWIIYELGLLSLRGKLIYLIVTCCAILVIMFYP